MTGWPTAVTVVGLAVLASVRDSVWFAATVAAEAGEAIAAPVGPVALATAESLIEPLLMSPCTTV